MEKQAASIYVYTTGNENHWWIFGCHYLHVHVSVRTLITVLVTKQDVKTKSTKIQQNVMVLS